MKKLMILAVMAVAANSAFSQSDAIKSILKAKDYTEAENLLNANLASLSAEQKAKAYNKLVDLAMDKVSHENTTISTNQIKVQMQQGDPDPYDTLGLFKATYNAMKNGLECDKYDNMANDKGKVSPKFRKSNQERLYKIRTQLINGGQYAAERNNQKEALNNYALYVETASTPLFADVENKVPDSWLGEVARVAAVYSFQEKDYANADKYCDVALSDTASHKEALGLKMYIMQTNLKTREDSLACLKKMEDFYAKENDEQVFNSVVNMYGSLSMDEKQLEFINSRLAIDPNSFTVWALKGQNEMNAGKWDEAITAFKKAIEIDGKKALVYTYLGFTYNSKAATLSSEAEQKALFAESLKYLEKARELDPNRQETNWSYPLYQCYYNLYGAADSRTKELEALVK